MLAMENLGWKFRAQELYDEGSRNLLGDVNLAKSLTDGI
jgi:hypothetical protein